MRDFAFFAFPALETLSEADQEVALEVLRAGRDPASAAEDRIMCAFNLAVADRYLALPPAEGGEQSGGRKGGSRMVAVDAGIHASVAKGEQSGGRKGGKGLAAPGEEQSGGRSARP